MSVRGDEPSGAGAMLAAYRAEEALPEAVHARVWARVEADIAPRRRWRGRAATVVVLAAAAVAAIWIGRAAFVPNASAPAPEQAPYQHDRASDVEQTTSTHSVRGIGDPPGFVGAPTSDASQSADVSVSPVPTIVPPGLPRAVDPRRRDRASEPKDELADETTLVRHAQAALRSGDPRRALVLLESGTQRFGVGKLAEERAALQVLALCAAARGADARREAGAFATRFPSSPLLARVRGACDDATAPP